MPGASLYKLCPILTMLCHVGSSPFADGNSFSTCHVAMSLNGCLQVMQAACLICRKSHGDTVLHALHGQLRDCDVTDCKT